MIDRFMTTVAGLLVAVMVGGCTSTLTRVSERVHAENASRRTIAITGATVLPMTSDGALADQTVLISDGVVVAMGDRPDISIPHDAYVIDARGKFLLPGLIDMHTHVSDDEDLLLLVANGVTTVRNTADLPWYVKTFMGFSDILDLRGRVRSGEVVGPDIVTSGLVLDGDPAVSPFNATVRGRDEAAAAVREQKKDGYDFIKVYDILTADDFQEILRVAREESIPVAGHVPFSVSVDTALASSMRSIEHLTGFINNNLSAFIIDTARIDAYARRAAESGIVQCPTLVVWDKLPPEGGEDSLNSYAEYAYVPWRIKWLWNRTMGTVYDIDPSLKQGYAQHMMEISKRMTKALYDAGCPLVVGTDMNFLGVFPGVSTRREVELLVEAGLTPLDALKAATVNAAACLGKDEIGTIARGKRADLLLLDGNPLDDIRQLSSTAGVMVRGAWIDKRMIGEIYEELR